MGLAILLILVVFGHALLFKSRIDFLLQDFFYQRQSPVSTELVIVGVDEETLDVLGRWPFPRRYHAELIKIIGEGEPTAIFMDFIFSEESDEDDLFLAALESFDRVLIPSYGVLDTHSREGQVLVNRWIHPTPEIKERSISAHINTVPDKDGIIRHALTDLSDGEEVLEAVAFTLYHQVIQHLNIPKRQNEIPLDPLGRMYIKYAAEPGSMTYFSYQRVLSGEIPADFFEDKIVLVGPYVVGIGDFYFTSIDHQVPMYGVEIHANILHQLMYGESLGYFSFLYSLLILLLLLAGSYYAFMKLKPLWATLMLVALLGAYTFLAVFLSHSKSLMPLASFYFSLVVIYLYTLAYKYILEFLERKRITGMFSKYVAPQIVNEVINRNEEIKLGGDRREIVALFVDIRGFTPLSEKAKPEEVVEILNEYLTLCAESIFKYEGTLDKFIGDATMAIYNAPLDQEDYIFKAVQSAWAMKQGAIPLEKLLRERFDRTVQFGIGLHVGPAVVGNIGADFRMDYTAIGDTVNTAARLESNAKPGQILMSEAVYLAVKERVEVTKLGGYQVKGKSEEIMVYQLDGLKGVISSES